MVKQDKYLYYIVGLITVFIIIYGIYNLNYSTPNIQTIHAINLDRDVKRWERLQASAAKANIPIERWPATYGKDIPYDQLRKLGIGLVMIKPHRGDVNKQQLVNQGVAGCFLSTRRLLTYLSKQSYSSSAGHLILDDDVNIPVDFISQWEAKRKNIPSDWDIVYLGIVNITGTTVAPGIKKLRSFRDDSKPNENVATFAYIVRHGSIQSKILPWLRYMFDAIDEQYIHKFDEWNVYGVEPDIITVDDEMSKASSIDAIQK